MQKKLTVTCFLFFIIFSGTLSAQEALKSVEEEYYSFLSLQGLALRPTLNYRTMSDSVWAIDDGADHPWQGQNLGTWWNLSGDIRARVYGPELFMSVNTAAPYGQNDGVLWQGRGFNAMIKAGARLEGYGFELTLLPHFAFSQNLEFDYIQPNYSGSNYDGKAGDYGYYGYYGVPSIDAPQRFGSKAFFDWDFGDSEIRYTWKTLTAGFGTQAIWLGPAQLNPIIHSNNAASYPKFDIGLRRQPVTIPKLNWYLGDVEFRAWWGYLSESGWFDNDSSNNHNLITGVSFAYSFPSFLTGLTLGFNRIMLSKWDAINTYSLFTVLWPFMDTGAGSDENDQRASITVDYLLPIAGANIYLEWGRNDFSPGVSYVVRYPFHSEAYTVGVRKFFSFSNSLKGQLMLEFSNLETSKDYLTIIPWGSTFYAHHVIKQGHTNMGQWLGAGIGTGGNSQYLGFKLYFPKGYGEIFVQRRNPDLDYTWFIDSQANFASAEHNIRAFMDYGASALYHITPDFRVSGSFVFRDEYNALNEYGNLTRRPNVYLSVSIAYLL